MFSFSSPADLASFVIYLGRYQGNGLNQHETSRTVRRVEIPYGYVEPQDGKDIALVQLSSPVTWSDYIRPICLPAFGTLFPGGLECYVTGWGNIRDDGKACVCVCVWITLTQQLNLSLFTSHKLWLKRVIPPKEHRGLKGIQRHALCLNMTFVEEAQVSKSVELVLINFK